MVSSSTEVQPDRLNSIRNWLDHHRRIALAVLAAWAIALGISFYVLMAYTQTTGPISDSPIRLAGFETKELPGQWSLVMAVHPQCPCTQSSVSELERLLARADQTPHCQFLIFVPREADPRWMQSPLVNRLNRIRGASIEADVMGKRAEALGMHTSGSVILADPNGIIRFSGGITAARNHEGDSAGKKAALMLLSGKQPPIDRAHVYGCRLDNEQQVTSDD